MGILFGVANQLLLALTQRQDYACDGNLTMPIGDETLQLAVDDSRLMLPYLAFAGPVAVMMSLLNAQSRFALTAMPRRPFSSATKDAAEP